MPHWNADGEVKYMTEFNLEQEIGLWKDQLRSKGHVSEQDILEMENHLVEEIDSLKEKSLSDDESFLVAIKRMGNLNAISMDYARSRSNALWKQMARDFGSPDNVMQHKREIRFLILCSLLAGIAGVLPSAILNIPFMEEFYVRNLFLFFVPFISLFMILRRGFTWKSLLIPAAGFFITALAINLYPFAPEGQTFFLSIIHLPFWTWGLFLFSYSGDPIPTRKVRMDFLRLSGEMFIFTILILCGVAVLTSITFFLFSTINIPAEDIIISYILPILVFASPVVGMWLADSKRSVIENIAPILARIFSPLFLVTLCVFLAVMVISGFASLSDRNFLIAADVMLAFVLALVLYIFSSRDNRTEFGLFDIISFALIAMAILIDVLALGAIVIRIADFGFSPNRTVALGENIILLLNLGGLAWHQGRFIMRKAPYSTVPDFQADYLYALLVWTGVVSLIVPILFRFA